MTVVPGSLSMQIDAYNQNHLWGKIEQRIFRCIFIPVIVQGICHVNCSTEMSP
jgi:hypothetical protein